MEAAEATAGEAVQQAQQQPASIYKLKQPINFDGQEVTELNLDLDRLTGEDVLKCEAQYSSMEGASTFLREADKGYQSVVAARAACVPVEMIRALKAKDFVRVTLRVQNFLLGTA